MLRPTACLLAPALAAVLCGCTLVDQRTFDPTAGLPPKIAQPPAAPGPMPLVTIDFGKPNPDYAEAVHQAVQAALARKPSAAFEVATVVPATGTPADQVAAAESVTPDARQVAREIASDGVPDEQIALTARAVPGVASQQVQVFVK